MASAARRVDFYWRGGCWFCSRLRRGLEAAGVELDDHDIWADDEARAFVRSVARGHETVPTVVVAGVALVNPSAAEVVARLDEAATEEAPEP
ncbi:MAG: NrdH-redoxin [Acidimicrobiia bacterium]|nr:NrdH-redoxin [Acidimicrobiia bacterium]